MTTTSPSAQNKGATDAERQEKLDREGDKEKAESGKDPAAATKRGEEDAYERLKSASRGLVEDINSMVHPDDDDPVTVRGSGKAGVPAGSEDYEKAVDKQLAKAKKGKSKDE